MAHTREAAPTRPTKRFDEKIFKHVLIPKGEAAAEIIGSLVFIVVIRYWTQILNFMLKIGMPDVLPLPNPKLVEAFSDWLIALAAIGALLGGIKFIAGRWNYAIAGIHTIHSLGNAALILIMATSGMLIRHETITAWSDISGNSTTQVQITSSIGITIFALILAVVSIGDSLRRWVQARQAESEPS